MKKSTTKKYEPATELLPLNWENIGDSTNDEYDDIQNLNELRMDATHYLAELFVNNILKIDTFGAGDIVNEVNDLLYANNSFQDIEKIIRKQFNIK